MRRNIHPKFLATSPEFIWHCDLAFSGPKAKIVHLICRDLFSGYIRGTYLGSRKTAKATLSAFKRMTEKVSPQMVSVDKGTEYAKLGRYLKSKGIKYTPLSSYQHAYGAEFSISKIRGLQRRMQTEGASKDLRKNLKDILNTLNNRPSYTGFTPKEGLKQENAGKIFQARYGKYLDKVREQFDVKEKARFKIGQKVRILNYQSASQEKTAFKRAQTRFSTVTFYIKEIKNTYPITYLITDEFGIEISTLVPENHLIEA